MPHIHLPSGRSFRLRLYPKPKGKAKARVSATLALFDPPAGDEIDTAAERLAAKVAELSLFNRNNAAILMRMPELGLRDWWLAGLYRTVWNMRMGRSPESGLSRYDVYYYAEDLSAEAEEDVGVLGAKLFADLGITVRLRNQARAHLWLPQRYGIAYPPLTTAAEGILRLPCSAEVAGLKRTGEDFIDMYAPFGLGDIWTMSVRPNRALPLAAAYAEKTGRWQAQWPMLSVFAWAETPTLRAVPTA